MTAGIEQPQVRIQPVLIGTRSVQVSWDLSKIFRDEGLEHQVLNAEKHKEEAQIISQAGQVGRVTIATNMAGRGTDIKLSEEAEKLGGLYVILTEMHNSPRIDRQLQGRCARQGQPGQTRSIVSLDDELLAQHGRLWRNILRIFLPFEKLSRSLVHVAFRLIQLKLTRRALAQRKQVLRTDTYVDESLGFSGRE